MNERIEKIKTFLHASPDDLFLNHALALEYIKIGEELLALHCFEKNRQIDPKYVATYYHLGKLQERLKRHHEALETYQAGMIVAKEAKDQHSYNELLGAFEDLEDM